MKILPSSMSKIDGKNINKLSCIVNPTEIIDSPIGNLCFYMGDVPLSTCPLLSEPRKVEFITPSSGVVWVKNTYPFTINIDDIQINNESNIINSFAVDMCATINEKINSNICFVFLLTNNHLPILEELALKSLYNYGVYTDIPVIIAGFSLTPKIKEKLSQYNCKIIDFHEHETFFAAGHKMSLWMLPRAIHANYFVFMDCDLLIGSDINGFLDTIQQYPDDKIYCNLWKTSLKDYYTFVSKSEDYANTLKQAHDIPDSIFKEKGYINAGFYVMPRICALNIDSLTQTYHDKIVKTKDFYYTEELVLNVCARRLNNIVTMPEGYNYIVTDPNTLEITEEGIKQNNKSLHVVHLISGPKSAHVQKVKQKVNWKINTDNVYKEETIC